MSDSDIEKIRELASQGKIVIPPEAEKLFPLSINPIDTRKHQWSPQDFEYCKITSIWGPFKNNQGGFNLSWGVKGIGFGEITFYLKDGKIDPNTAEWSDGKIMCDNEGMSKDFIKAALEKFLESVQFVLE